MALKRFDIAYLDESKPTDRVTVGVGEQLIAKRDCLDQDDEYKTIYTVWLAAKREGKTADTFAGWSAAVGDIQPVFTVAMIDELYASGGIEEDIAERMKTFYTESGESQTPLSQ
jgi:hypothetical protein